MSHGWEYATPFVPATRFIAALNSLWLLATNIRQRGSVFIYTMSSVQHYNAVARNPPKGCGSMRLAHNQCKRFVISRALQVVQLPLEQCTVYDLACGRGGDLNKLRGCRQYHGIDTARDALLELERRARELNMAVATHHGDASTAPVQPCQIVLCNFAVHYFCDDKAHCGALLDTVAACLVPGGVFCGTYERVSGGVQWGMAHHAVVGDCVDAIEWRVPWDKFLALALARGLALVETVPFYMIDMGSDPGICGFILQQAQGQYYGSSATVPPTAGNRDRPKGGTTSPDRS